MPPPYQPPRWVCHSPSVPHNTTPPALASYSTPYFSTHRVFTRGTLQRKCWGDGRVSTDYPGHPPTPCVVYQQLLLPTHPPFVVQREYQQLHFVTNQLLFVINST